MREGAEEREVGRRREKTSGEDDPLATDPIGEHAEDDEEGRPQEQRRRHQDVRGAGVDLERLREEEEGVELAGVPDDRLTRGEPEEREQDDLEVPPLGERLAERRLRPRPLGLHRLEDRRLVELEPDPDRDPEQQERDEEWDAPPPRLEGFSTERHAATEDDEEGEEEPHRRRRLDPRGVGAALTVRRVLGDISGRAAVLPAEGEALEQPQQHQDHWRREPDRRVRGEDADHEGRDPHDDDRDQEGVLAADEVTEAAEDERAEGPDRESRREGEECEDERRSRVHAGEELPADDRREGTVEVEVVPLEHRAEGRREDHTTDIGRGVRKERHRAGI